MAWTEVKSRMSTQVRDMTIQNGPSSMSETKQSSALLFKLKNWSRIGVRARFRILDVILNCVLFTPLAVLFQVGASGMQDFLFLKSVSPSTGTVILLALGIGIEFACSFWQRALSELRLIRNNNPESPSYIVATRFYHFAVGFANVCHYRGLSDLYYAFAGTESYGAIQTITTTVIALSGLRCARNILGPPLCVGVDSTIGDFFETSTMFRTQNDKYVKHMADNFATVMIVATLCFLHWISVWALFDCIIFPDNLFVSVIVSWIIGYAIVITAHVLETPAKKVSRELGKRNKALKTLFEDFVLISGNVGVILVWRGHWIFFESLAYYFPIYHNGTDMTAFYGNFSATVMMCLLHASATLLMKGCDFDGELDEGEGLSFGVNYFAEFFREEIEEQIKVEQEQSRRRQEERRGTGAQAVLNNNMYNKGSTSEERRDFPLRPLNDQKKTK